MAAFIQKVDMNQNGFSSLIDCRAEVSLDMNEARQLMGYHGPVAIVPAEDLYRRGPQHFIGELTDRINKTTTNQYAITSRRKRRSTRKVMT